MNVWLQISNGRSQSPQNMVAGGNRPSDLQSPGRIVQDGQFVKKGARQRWNTSKLLYNWNKIQDRKYINFLRRNKGLFSLSSEDRKCIKINVIMSETIRSRTAAQCHSHHQKMMLKFGTIDNIITSYQHLIQETRPQKPLSPSSQLQSNSNQSCKSLYTKNGEIEQFGQRHKEPEWHRYVDLYSAAEFSHMVEESFEN